MTGAPLLAAAALGAIASCGGGDDDGGFEFDSPEGDFTVTFDEEPTTREEQVTLPDGRVLAVPFYFDEAGTTTYAVSSIDYGAGTPASLTGARDGAIANIAGAELVDEAELELDGRQGLQFVADINEGAADFVARIYVDDTRLYQLIVGGADVAPDDDDVVEFFESFQFTEAGG